MPALRPDAARPQAASGLAQSLLYYIWFALLLSWHFHLLLGGASPSALALSRLLVHWVPASVTSELWALLFPE